MARTYRSGDPVLLSGLSGGTKSGTVDRDYTGGAKVWVLLEGKTKPKPVAPSKVRPNGTATRVRPCAVPGDLCADGLCPRCDPDSARRIRAELGVVEPARKAIRPPPIRRGTTVRPELVAQPKPAGPYRSAAYLAFVRQHPCTSCRTKAVPRDAHHWASTRGAGQKVDDTRTVPLCRKCHDELHATGSLPSLDVLASRLMLLDRQVWLLTAYVRSGAERTR